MSELADKEKVCIDCNADFLFTIGEQEFFRDKGFENEPKRCETCRKAKKKARNSGERLPDVEVVCDDCGKDTTVPFKPTGDKPVYCRECFAKRRPTGDR